MTYLELCQKLRLEAGISGVGPATTVDQIGQLKKITEWINDSWFQLQLRQRDWQFLWRTFSFTTVASVQDYTPLGAAELGFWDGGSFRLYVASKADERALEGLSFQCWRSRHEIGEIRENVPTSATIMPDKSIRLTPTPDGEYTVSANYYQAPQKMTSDNDIPLLPERYHDLIVYEALALFGMHEEAMPVVQQARVLAAPLWMALCRDQLPKMGLPGPLA